MRWYDATMPRTARATEAGTVYHVLNRGNGRMRIFHKDGDYEAFLRVLSEGLERYPVELFTYCLMPTIGIWSCGTARTTPWAAGWAG